MIYNDFYALAVTTMQLIHWPNIKDKKEIDKQLESIINSDLEIIPEF